MDSKTAEALAVRAKESDKITKLKDEVAIGASAFLDTFSGLSSQYEGVSCKEACKRVIAYLEITTSHWRVRKYRKGAKIASDVIENLHAAI